MISPDDKKEIKEMIREVIEPSHMSVSQTISDFGSEVKKLNGIGRVPKFFKTDFGFLVAVVLFLVSILTPYYLIKIDIAVIFEKLNSASEQIRQVANDISIVNKDQHIISDRVSKLEGVLLKF